MADKQSFDDFMASLKDQLEKDGFEITDSDALKDAYEASEKGLSLDEVKRFGKKKDDESTVINEETPASSEEKTDEKENDAWKEKLRAEWKKWAEENNQLYDDFVDPDHKNNLSFHLYENEAKKKEGIFLSEISYSTPNNMSVKGYEGTTPSVEIFAKILDEAKKNGPNIEFGKNLKPEFAANLMVACLKDPNVNIVNPPTEDQMKRWPENLQEMVAKAQAEADKRTENPGNEDTPKEEEKPKTYGEIWNEVAAHKMDHKGQEFDLEKITDNEQKAMYFAATIMAGIKAKGTILDEDIKEITNPEILKRLDEAKSFHQSLENIKASVSKGTIPEIDLNNFKTPEKKALWMMAALDGGAKIKDPLSADDIKALPEHLQLPLIRKQREAKLAELRARGAQLHGNDEKTFDAQREEERAKRAEKTMSDVFKYEREVEMDADGKTPKKDEKTGQPVYKKNDKDEFIYKTDDKGNKIETPGYQAFKKRLADYGKPK